MSDLSLYAKSDLFDGKKIGTLDDVVDDIVHWQLNGMYELEFKYPYQGQFIHDIVEGCWIQADPFMGQDDQPFQIYRITKPMRGFITVYARHMAYAMRNYVVPPFACDSARAAVQRIQNTAVPDFPFDFSIRVSGTAHMETKRPRSAWDILGGKRDSILSTYGGELRLDYGNIYVLNHYGFDDGVKIVYGKNLTDINQDRNIYDMYNAIYPYWSGSDQIVQLDERYISGPGKYTTPKIQPVDFSQEFKDPPTQSQLRAAAQKYIDDHGVGIPKVSIEVKFQPLWQTEEYKDLKLLEYVGPGDTVTVEYPDIGVSATARVVETQYQPTQGKYKSITLGQAKPTLSSTIVDQQDQLDSQKHDIEAIKKGDLEIDLESATKWLTDGKGHLVVRKGPDGQPIDILFMDDPNVLTARNVLRIGQSGIGFSANGVNGPYKSAWTLDGKFVADWITAGVLKADIIKAGILADKAGKNFIDLETGEAEINCQNLTIRGVTPKQMAEDEANNAILVSTDYAKKVASALSEDLKKLQDQVDGQTMTWFGQETPTQNNYPANEWTTPELKNAHLGDLYYVTQNPELGSKAYRWVQLVQGGYRWEELVDTEALKALQLASEAKAAADGKVRTFLTQPVPPYDEGDLWVPGETGEIKVCVASKAEGMAFQAADWDPAANYNKEAQEALQAFSVVVNNNLRGLQTQIDEKTETWFYPYNPRPDTLPESEWTTDEIKAKHIDDLFYNTDTGRVYRYASTMLQGRKIYSWYLIQDNDIQKALRAASKAEAAADGKIRMFQSVALPAAPYDVGDLWTTGSSGSLKVCIKNKISGETADKSDWIPAAGYITKDTAGNLIDNDLYKFAQYVAKYLFQNADEARSASRKTTVWFRSKLQSDPSDAWTTPELINMHDGDMMLYYNYGLPKVKQFHKNADGTGGWGVDFGNTDVGALFARVEQRSEAASGHIAILFNNPNRETAIGDLLYYVRYDELWVAVKAGAQGGIDCFEQYGKESMRTAVKDIVTATVDSGGLLTQSKIFDALTDNGRIQGIFMRGGQLYLNASYIGTGILADPNRRSVFNLSTGELTIGGGTINISNRFKVRSDGYFEATGGRIGNFNVAPEGIGNKSYILNENGLIFRRNYMNTLGEIRIKDGKTPDGFNYSGMTFQLGSGADSIGFTNEHGGAILEYHKADRGGGDPNTIDINANVNFGGRKLISASIDPNTGGGRGCYNGELRIGNLRITVKNGFIVSVR